MHGHIIIIIIIIGARLARDERPTGARRAPDRRATSARLARDERGTVALVEMGQTKYFYNEKH